MFPDKVAVRSVHKKSDIIPWMKNVSEIKMMAEVDTCFIFGGEASDVGAGQWSALAETIKKNYAKYDGFVITHGIETLPYTAAMLSFMLQNLGKPVILTGSPIPSKEEASAEILQSIFKNFRGLGVKANLINATQVAISDIAGVLVIFGSRIISGTKAEGLSLYSDDKEKEKYKVIGKIDFGLTLYDVKAKRNNKKPFIKESVDPKVSIFDFHPGMDTSLLKNILEKDVHGLIIKTQSTSFFPEAVYAMLKKALKNKIPIVIYSTGGFKRVKEGDFIYVENMNLITTVVKLMWILGQTKSMKTVKKMMATDYTGEINNV